MHAGSFGSQVHFQQGSAECFLTLCREGACGERAWAFPCEEFKERKGSARSLHSGTMNWSKCFSRTQFLMELSVHT